MKSLYADKKTFPFITPPHIVSSRFIVSFLFLITLAGLAASYQFRTADIFQAAEHFTVVLDAGHGGGKLRKITRKVPSTWMISSDTSISFRLYFQ